MAIEAVTGIFLYVLLSAAGLLQDSAMELGALLGILLTTLLSAF